MALSIKNDETERLARQVARETGESLTEAIQKALQERWERLKARRRSQVLAGQVEDLLRRVDALPRSRLPARGRNPRLRRARGAALMVIDTSALLAIFLGEPGAQSTPRFHPAGRNQDDLRRQRTGNRDRAGSQTWRIRGTGIRSFRCAARTCRSSPWMANRPRLRVRPGANMERTPSGSSQLRRLLRLCPGEVRRRTLAGKGN